MTLIFAPISGRLVGSRGPRPSLVAAGIAMTIATLMLTRLETDTSLAWLFTAYAIFGFGFGVVNAPITNTAVSGLAARAGRRRRRVRLDQPPDRLDRSEWPSIGSAATARVVGDFRSGFPAASHVGWWILTGCALAVLILGVLTTGRGRGPPPTRAAERLREPAAAERSSPASPERLRSRPAAARSAAPTRVAGCRATARTG